MLNDKELLVLLQTDARQGLAAAITRYGGLARHICRNILGDRPEDVDECVSDAFAILWTNAAGLDPAAGSIKSYICAVSRHKALDRYRRLSGQPTFVPIDDATASGTGRESLSFDPDMAGTVAATEHIHMLTEAVDELPPPDREIIILRYFYYEKVKSIAKRLDLPEKTVENKLYRGKAVLRKKLEEKGFVREDV
jgi:RNA polymerase sigma-70 factor (ECF subfamily)